MINNSHTDLLESHTTEEIKSLLLATSTILSSYEIVKSMVLGRTKFSFLTGCGYGGDKYSEEYQTDVLVRDKSPLIASAKYLAEHYEAISSADVMGIVALRSLRNDIAHNLPAVLTKYDLESLKSHVSKARDLVFKLDNFWMYIEIGHDPEHRGTNWDTAYSNATMFVDRLVELNEGNNDRNG